MLDELYQDIILQAARDSEFRGSLSGVAGAVNVRMHNPLCGDALDVWAKIDNDRVQDVRCEGHGCLISQASASLFMREVQDLSVEEAEELCRIFREMVQKGITEEEMSRIGNLSALSGIRRLPARSRCALLACEALERIIRHQKNADQDGVPLRANGLNAASL